MQGHILAILGYSILSFIKGLSNGFLSLWETEIAKSFISRCLEIFPCARNYKLEAY